MTHNIVKIFDTTLRDGEQSPGFGIGCENKIKMAKQLAKLGVDVIEAGFANASDDDFSSIQKIAQQVKTSKICSLARCHEEDIKKAAQALRPAGDNARIHVFISTSPVHMQKKLNMQKEQVKAQAVKSVAFAKSFVKDVEFSAEDALRSDPQFLIEVFKAVIEAGATTINIPDTVGYTEPSEMYAFIKHIHDAIPSFQEGSVTLSVHCHDDLGMATANSMAAIKAGARQVEGCINGIGERAGNAAVEEVVMALKTREDIYQNIKTNIQPKQIGPTSALLQRITGQKVQPNKAIVGKNAFSHESGVHQDGMLKDSTTYEIMTPKSVGMGETNLVLGKHSGARAVAQKVGGIFNQNVDPKSTAMKSMMVAFKAIADKTPNGCVTDDVIREIALKYIPQVGQPTG